MRRSSNKIQCVGDPTNIDYVGLQQMAPTAPVDESEDSADESLMDFDMI